MASLEEVCVFVGAEFRHELDSLRTENQSRIFSNGMRNLLVCRIFAVFSTVKKITTTMMCR